MNQDTESEAIQGKVNSSLNYKPVLIQDADDMDFDRTASDNDG